MKLQNLKNYTALDIETSGLNPLTSGITCICGIDEQNDTFLKSIPRNSLSNYALPKDEIQLIFNFLKWLNQRSYTTLLTFNGISFDIPFILSRLTYLLNSVPQQHITLREYRHLDIFNTCTKWVSLSSYCEILNLENKTGTGYEAITLWKNDKLIELENYCLQDVKCLINVYKKLLEIRGLN